MKLNQEKKKFLQQCAEKLPFPIASGCRNYIVENTDDPWRAWELLSRSILLPILHYMSHLLLSDLVASGEKPKQLYHHIQAILSRPMAGQYVGFLRETARFYKDAGLKSSIPELVHFLVASEIETSIIQDKRGLLALLVEYRNAFAHGRTADDDSIAATAALVFDLTMTLLSELQFLAQYRLRLDDSTVLMGHQPSGLDKKAMPLQVVTAGETNLRPLLLKLEGHDLVLLEEADISKPVLTFRGVSTYHGLTKKQLSKGDPKLVFEALLELLSKVRSEKAILPRPNWEDFTERAELVTLRTYDAYKTTFKYDPDVYVPLPAWEGEKGLLNRFLASNKTLLAITGGQGTGKSALTARLVTQCSEAGQTVLFINAQRLTYADVKWSENPLPGFFQQLLHYDTGLDAKGLKRLAKQVPPGKKIVVFLDAVNEVDSIRNKWNPFRALEDILSWISESVHSNLKFVITFRLDLYESFGYLEETTLPENINEIGFAGNHASKKWLYELERFNHEQAQTLYMLLQQLPGKCMAPAMTWEQLSTGLDETASKFFSNPLLFKVFLQVHHQSDRVLARNEYELFQRYADQLTGAAHLRQRPWWRRAVGFLVNGNITTKEQFLADSVRKMGKNGSAAFLEDKLDKKQSLDKRLLRFLNSPNKRDYDDLTEGGLMVSEAIELKQGDKEIVTKRFTFVGELMAVALEGVSEKLNRRSDFRSSSFFVLFSILFLLGIEYAFLYSYQTLLMKRDLIKYLFPDLTFLSGEYTKFFLEEASNIYKTAIASTIDIANIIVFLPLVLILSLFLLIPPLIRKKTSRKNQGLVMRGCEAEKATLAVKTLTKFNFFISIFPLLFSLLIYLVIPDSDNLIIGVFPLIGLIIILFTNLWFFGHIEYYCSTDSIGYNKLIILYREYIHYLSTSSDLRHETWNYVIIDLVIGFVACLIGSLVILLDFVYIIQIPPLNSARTLSINNTAISGTCDLYNFFWWARWWPIGYSLFTIFLSVAFHIINKKLMLRYFNIQSSYLSPFPNILAKRNFFITVTVFNLIYFWFGRSNRIWNIIIRYSSTFRENGFESVYW